MGDSFYREVGPGRYESSEATAGPWSPRTQHAGPPSALIGYVLQAHEPRERMRIARVTVEILRPVPVAEIEVSVRTVHTTGRTQVLEGQIVADGKPVLLARAWRLAESPSDTPTLRHAPAARDRPASSKAFHMSGAHLGGYLSAMEWRFVQNGGFEQPGPGIGWARQKIPLLPDAEDTPLTRALVFADSSWAVGAELDHIAQLTMNVDVALSLHRDPIGEWLCLQSSTAASPRGAGVAEGVLHDQAGECGRVLQTLLIAAR